MSSPEKPEGITPELWEFATRDWKGAIHLQAERLNQIKNRMKIVQCDLKTRQREIENVEKELTDLRANETATLYALQAICQLPYSETEEKKSE